ncbi:MAG: response regulator, partial [Chloroflexi bacterium]|nr:response regulator [Chloroflexota bacterium]
MADSGWQMVVGSVEPMKDTSSAISHPPSAISHPPSATSHQPRILVVDDEPDVCWALENILCPAGYAVTTTTRGVEALELLARQPYAVAFVDAKLPDLDGLELVAMIHQRNPRTAVVLISGYYYQEDPLVMEGLAKNLYVGFVSKPFSLNE